MSLCLASSACSTGWACGQKLQQRSRGEAGGSESACSEGYFDTGVEIPLPKPLPKPRTAQGHTEPIDTQNLLLETVLPFREMRPSSTEMNTSSPQPGSRHRTLVQAHPLGANSTTKKNKHLENFFLSFKSQFLFLLHTSTFMLAFCRVMDFSFFFFFLRFFPSFFVILFCFCSFFYVLECLFS